MAVVFYPKHPLKTNIIIPKITIRNIQNTGLFIASASCFFFFCKPFKSWPGLNLLPQDKQDNSTLLLPIVPARIPIPPVRIAPPTACVPLKPFFPPITFIDLHFGHLILFLSALFCKIGFATMGLAIVGDVIFSLQDELQFSQL